MREKEREDNRGTSEILKNFYTENDGNSYVPRPYSKVRRR